MTASIARRWRACCALPHSTPAPLECFRRAILPDQPAEIASRLRRDGANLSCAMTDLLDALARKRVEGPQVVWVERVVVQDGGQAIVSNVQPVANGGGGP